MNDVFTESPLEVTADQLSTYLRTFGKRGQVNLSILGRVSRFVEAMRTEVGKEMLLDLANEHERLLARVASLSASEEEKAEYRVIRALLTKWSQKISFYYEETDKIRKSLPFNK